MTSSIENPYKDFEINALGTINVLEAVRKFSPKTAVFFLAQIKSMVIQSNMNIQKMKADISAHNFQMVLMKQSHQIFVRLMVVQKGQQINI